MGIVEEAFTGLYPGRELRFTYKVSYSAAFKGYNAKVKYTSQFMEFRLSRLWKDVSDEIKIGLVQSLFNKIFNTDNQTLNIELYDIFLKKIPKLSPKESSHPMLEASFDRVNEQYFNGIIDRPNLEFSGNNLQTLGLYDYGTDTIKISSLLAKDMKLMDYVMYHEMLHKRLKYKQAGRRRIHHSRTFREFEKKFEDPDIEKKLKDFLRGQRRWF